MPPFPPSRMNKRKVKKKNHALFPLQKLEKITIFLQSAKVTQKRKEKKRINKTQAPLPLHLQIKVDCSPLKTQPDPEKGINVFSPPLLLFLNKI
jgi:hypothetical protein